LSFGQYFEETYFPNAKVLFTPIFVRIEGGLFTRCLNR
jgi:hypothetical protein